MKKIFTTIALLAAAFSAFADAPKKIALFVCDESGNPALAQKTAMIESSLASRLNAAGFSVAGRALALESLDAYLGRAGSVGKERAKEFAAAVSGGAYSRISESASALRAAEFLGADCVLAVSAASLGSEKKSFSGYGVKTDSVEYVLQCNFSASDASGAGVAGGTAVSSRAVKSTQNLKIASDDILNALADDCAAKIASQLAASPALSRIEKPAAFGELEIECLVEGMSVPVVAFENGEYKVAQGALPIAAASASIEVDGVAASGGKIKLSRGIHIVKVSQKGLEPFERAVNVTGEAGQKVVLMLRMTDAERLRWKEDAAFLESLAARAKASDSRATLLGAEAEKLRGMAEMFRQSGFKIKADSLPETKVQSIFAQ